MSSFNAGAITTTATPESKSFFTTHPTPSTMFHVKHTSNVESIKTLTRSRFPHPTPSPHPVSRETSPPNHPQTPDLPSPNRAPTHHPSLVA